METKPFITTPAYIPHNRLALLVSSWIYSLVLWFYFNGIKLAALSNPKASIWIQGRKNIFKKLRQDFQKPLVEGQKIVWVHCSSAGEFEQGRTFIEGLRKERNDIRILLTFFSASGYELQKNYPGADWIHYLPADTPTHAKQFVEIVQPALVVFVKYDFWFHFLQHLKMKAIPVLLISASFRKSQPFFQWYGTLHRYMLNCFTRIQVQTASSMKLLDSIGIQHVTIGGDTRTDRVLAIAEEKKSIPLIENFCSGHKVLVCGSTWPKDEEILISLCQNPEYSHWRFVIAPHEIHKNRIQELSNRLQNTAVLYSTLSKSIQVPDATVMIIDNIGLLSSIYRYAYLAYIGGGFGKGIHSILEPAAYGLPIFFGKNYHKFAEATELVQSGGAFVIHDKFSLSLLLKKMEKPAFYSAASSAVSSYIKSSGGATERAINEALELL